MKRTWKRFAMAGAALGLVLALSMVLRREPRIDYLVSGPGRIPHQQLAIEREVIQAELAQYGTELIPSLRSELRRGQWHRSSLVKGLLRYCPNQLAEAIVNADAQDDQRRTKAALLLGRLGPKAQIAVPELQTMASLGGNTVYPAEVALAMIQPTSMTERSNALAALASPSQPRRAYFALHADELWPDQPDVLEGCLSDPDATVRAHALTALCSYGSRASNAVPIVQSLLADHSFLVRPRSALALGLVAPQHGQTAVAVMLDQQRTNNSWTADLAPVLYQSLGPSAEPAEPLLRAALADARMSMFHGDVAGALWRISHSATPQIIDGLATGVRIGVQRSQIRCLRILKEIGPPAAAAIPVLNTLTNHPLILIRKLAREALQGINSPQTK